MSARDELVLQGYMCCGGHATFVYGALTLSSPASYEHLACCGIHYTPRPGGHCDWTCCEHEPPP